MKTKAIEPRRRAMFLLVTAVAVALIMPSLVGCRSTDGSSPTRYVVAATLAGYDIQAVSDRPTTIDEHDDHVLISFANHRLRVEKGRVVLDDNETAAFPVTAKQIVVEMWTARSA